MSHGSRPVPAARLVILGLLTTMASEPGHCLGGGPPPLPDSRLGHRQAPLLLLTRPEIRAELKLSAEQTTGAERALTELYARAAALKGKTGPEALAGRRAIDEAQESWLRTSLSEAQRKRLLEIDLQWEGASALKSRPVVADHLGLTNEQRARLAEAIAERDHQRDADADLFESEKQLTRTVRAMLTQEQQDRWKAMLGHSFTLHLADKTPSVAPR